MPSIPSRPHWPEPAALLAGADGSLEVFTTRCDTLFGATYMVVAPEHPLLSQLTTNEQREQVEQYVATAANKSDLERTELQKHKTGVFTGLHVNACKDMTKTLAGLCT